MQMTVLLLVVAVALCGAHPTNTLENVTCHDAGLAQKAADFTVDHINDHHHHGYEFKLTKVNSSRVEPVDDECTITLELSLEETKCHFTNPKPVEDCELRRHMQTVTAKCKVVLHFGPEGANHQGTSDEISDPDCETYPAV
ncbi:hypothetical protein CRUP_006303, partial [Coryphaenoides rupestris]